MLDSWYNSLTNYTYNTYQGFKQDKIDPYLTNNLTTHSYKLLENYVVDSLNEFENTYDLKDKTLDYFQDYFGIQDNWLEIVSQLHSSLELFLEYGYFNFEYQPFVEFKLMMPDILNDLEILPARKDINAPIDSAYAKFVNSNKLLQLTLVARNREDVSMLNWKLQVSQKSTSKSILKYTMTSNLKSNCHAMYLIENWVNYSILTQFIEGQILQPIDVIDSEIHLKNTCSVVKYLQPNDQEGKRIYLKFTEKLNFLNLQEVELDDYKDLDVYSNLNYLDADSTIYDIYHNDLSSETDTKSNSNNPITKTIQNSNLILLRNFSTENKQRKTRFKGTVKPNSATLKYTERLVGLPIRFTRSSDVAYESENNFLNPIFQNQSSSVEYNAQIVSFRKHSDLEEDFSCYFTNYARPIYFKDHCSLHLSGGVLFLRRIRKQILNFVSKNCRLKLLLLRMILNAEYSTNNNNQTTSRTHNLNFKKGLKVGAISFYS